MSEFMTTVVVGDNIISGSMDVTTKTLAVSISKLDTFFKKQLEVRRLS